MNTRRLARRAVTVLAAVAVALLAGSALAQQYPNRVIKMIVPFAPGGQPDTIARIIAQHLSMSVGTTIIDNSPGANTTIGAKAAIASEPDGYTLFFGTSTSLAIVPATKPGEYDPLKVFAPVAAVSSAPFIIAVGPSDVRCIQVKANEYLSGVERESIKALPMPANVTREYWRFVDGEPRTPRIEIL